MYVCALRHGVECVHERIEQKFSRSGRLSHILSVSQTSTDNLFPFIRAPEGLYTYLYMYICVIVWHFYVQIGITDRVRACTCICMRPDRKTSFVYNNRRSSERAVWCIRRSTKPYYEKSGRRTGNTGGCWHQTTADTCCVRLNSNNVPQWHAFRDDGVRFSRVFQDHGRVILFLFFSIRAHCFLNHLLSVSDLILSTTRIVLRIIFKFLCICPRYRLK